MFLKLLPTFFLLSLTLTAISQKPALTIEDIDQWNSIDDATISPNGNWVSYERRPNQGDPTLVIYNQGQQAKQEFTRSHNAAFSADSRVAAFHTSPAADSLKAMRRAKVKDKDLPKDTLTILQLRAGSITKVPRLKRFLMPGKWEGWMAYQLLPAPRDTSLPDSVKVKPENEDHGSLLIIRNLRTGQQDSIPYVKDFIAAEESPRFLIHSTGDDSTFQQGVYLYDGPEARLTPLLTGKGHYTQLSLSQDGTQAGFLAVRDTTKFRVVPYELWHWKTQQKEATAIADSTSAFLPEGWLLSEHGDLTFSEDGNRLFFGTCPPPILKDTSLLEEEIVNVEVWTSQDPRLYTHEEELLEANRKRSYRAVFHTDTRRLLQLADQKVPELMPGDEGNARYALGKDETPYLQLISWEGFPQRNDLYLVDVETGSRQRIAENLPGRASLSPMGQYAYWYNVADTAWVVYDIPQRATRKIAQDIPVPLYDELDDHPMHPSPHGTAGWTTDDDFIMIYDRYDVWLVDPRVSLASNNLTKGRASKTRYRYIKLDPEERSIEEVKPMLFHTFDESDKSSGYTWFNIHTGVKDQVQYGAFSYDRRVQKARNADAYLFSRERFEVFPDLLTSNDHLTSFTKVSNANPQQEKFRWGTAEPYRWTGADGQKMEGILIKPEGFDPGLQYPMMTYFYERYADRLHRHWTPAYPRSVINFSFYASRGYVIFIPDVHYRIGYPGESALDAITTGVTSLLDKGFVDKERLGVQGHSWGGYQVAYLITQTDLFKCAESGAPVVNMTSAYGGIRWGSGLSRMFQYEKSQSRIGGTLWEKPLRYIENSPLFYTDKINTPVLILHNDEDGAVPWYQGIEFFVALRRLNKPAWLLNYNENPHWVMGKENRRDFMQRMQQFFDYFLLNAPKPRWMEKGIPPMERGINQGFEPVIDDRR
ncbi:MAG: prolyl oligopeptidase family serine peptidase [Phaeodactylibacter sp.]|uniref:alpha/beta hydrolase family protein n=1 Tax=Phaeodactylibacter sp. TaxID=1940289 RepID=UPI0032ECC848